MMDSPLFKTTLECEIRQRLDRSQRLQEDCRLDVQELKVTMSSLDSRVDAIEAGRSDFVSKEELRLVASSKVRGNLICLIMCFHVLKTFLLPACYTHVYFFANMQVDNHDFQEKTMGLKQLVNRHELTQSLNEQVRPLTTAIAALERAVQIQEATFKSNRRLEGEKVASEFGKEDGVDLVFNHEVLLDQKLVQLVEEALVRQRFLPH